MNCIKCGCVLREEARFCTQCGCEISHQEISTTGDVIEDKPNGIHRKYILRIVFGVILYLIGCAITPDAIDSFMNHNEASYFGGYAVILVGGLLVLSGVRGLIANSKHPPK